MEIVLGALRRKKSTQAEAGSLLILICTDDDELQGEQGSVMSEKREPSVGRRSRACSKSRTGSSSLCEQSCLAAKLNQCEDGWGWGRDRHRHLLV